MPRRLGFAGGLAWIAAADLLVLSSRYAELGLCESPRRAGRIFYFGDRASVDSHGTDSTHYFGYFQQRELVARECGDRVRPLVRASPGQSLSRDRFALAEALTAKITVLDVGAGAAVHIRSDGKDWLLDCGSARDYERVLRSYLHAAGVNRLEGLLLSHGDSLHIGAAHLLVRDFDPRCLIDNSTPDRSTIHRRLRDLFSNRRINVTRLSAGENFTSGSALSGRVLFPPSGFSATTADDQALFVQLSVESAKILFTSDSGFAAEKWLLASGADLRSDILIKGQHHSGNSGSDAFLNSVQPRLIIATSREFPEHERTPDEWAERVRARHQTFSSGRDRRSPGGVCTAQIGKRGPT